MKPMTEQHLAILRRHMVEIIDMHFDRASEEIGKQAIDPGVRRALLAVPRHLFAPAQFAAVSYQDTPLPIGFDKTLSQPFIGALMIDLLHIQRDTRVLEVGTGLGYQAAVMAEMGAQVFTVEIVEEFAEAAALRFAACGHHITGRVGNGVRGWQEHAPFDRILVTAAAPEVPPALLQQLKSGGRMVIPLGNSDVQQITVAEKTEAGEASTRRLLPVRFTHLEGEDCDAEWPGKLDRDCYAQRDIC